MHLSNIIEQTSATLRFHVDMFLTQHVTLHRRLSCESLKNPEFIVPGALPNNPEVEVVMDLQEEAINRAADELKRIGDVWDEIGRANRARKLRNTRLNYGIAIGIGSLMLIAAYKINC